MTIDEITARLNLKPFEQVEAESKQRGIYPRASGRTTKMLLEVIEVAQSKQVLLIGLNTTCCGLMLSDIRKYCDRLGFDASNITVRTSARPDEEFRGLDAAYFVDHAVYDVKV